jgi:hypothetical protein
VVRQGPIGELREVSGGTQVEVDLRVFNERFVDAVKSRGGTLSHRQGSQVRFEFAAGTPLSDAGARLFSAARESGAQVRGFRPAQRSLEDVFLEAVAS